MVAEVCGVVCGVRGCDAGGVVLAAAWVCLGGVVAMRSERSEPSWFGEDGAINGDLQLSLGAFGRRQHVYLGRRGSQLLKS